jgi:hypothetical protein
VRRLISGELIKVRTTRTALGFGTASVLLVLALVLIGFLAGDPKNVDDKRDALNVGGVLSVPLLIFGIVGATGEYRHRTIAPAVLIAPGRGRLTVARLIAYTLTGLLFGALMVIVALVVGLPLAGGGEENLATSDILAVAFGGMLVAVLTVALGVGVGVLVRNQVAGVVGALIWLFILSPVLGLIDDDLPNYTTLPAAGVVGGSSDPGGLAFGTAVIVLVVWAAVFFVAALLVERRRDVD